MAFCPCAGTPHPSGPLPLTCTGQYLAQTEELGDPAAQQAVLQQGLAHVHCGQCHLSPEVPGQQLGMEHMEGQASSARGPD